MNMTTSLKRKLMTTFHTKWIECSFSLIALFPGDCVLFSHNFLPLQLLCASVQFQFLLSPLPCSSQNLAASAMYHRGACS